MDKVEIYKIESNDTSYKDEVFIQDDINDHIKEMEDMNYSRGYIMSVKNVEIKGIDTKHPLVIILYSLKDDPSFNPPM